MTAPTLDAAVFQRRARNLFDYWKVGAVVVCVMRRIVQEH